MIEVSRDQHVQLPRETAFGFGVQKTVWPTHIKNLLLQPEDDILADNGKIRMGLAVSHWALGRHKIAVPARVTQFDFGHSITIEGKNGLASARFNLTTVDAGGGGMDARWELGIALSGVAKRMRNEIQTTVETAAGEFHDAFFTNIIRLGEEHASRRVAKKSVYLTTDLP